MAHKKLKKAKKKEDLPSFLFPVPDVSENGNFLPKTSKSVYHLGLIFFGSHEYQPMFHSLNLGLIHEIHKTPSSTENILRDAFLPKPHVETRSEGKKITYFSAKRHISFTGSFQHKCPGFRKIFVPEPSPITYLGETESVIEGEASEEIPVCSIRNSSNGATETECEVIILSDIWEKKRTLMSYKERMAHAHFPKQFVTVRRIGPTIPASITITKLPSKRKTESELCLDLKTKAKTKKGAKMSDVKSKNESEDKVTEKESLSISEDIPSTKEHVKVNDVQGENVDEANEESDPQKLLGEDDVTQLNKEPDKTEELEVKSGEEKIEVKSGEEEVEIKSKEGEVEVEVNGESGEDAEVMNGEDIILTENEEAEENIPAEEEYTD